MYRPADSMPGGIGRCRSEPVRKCVWRLRLGQRISGPRQTYGPERLQHDLAEHGIKVGICRIKRIREKLGIRCKQKGKFKATTDSRHRLPVAENILGQQ